MFTPVNICWSRFAGVEVRDVYPGKHDAVALRSREYENGQFEDDAK